MRVTVVAKKRLIRRLQTLEEGKVCYIYVEGDLQLLMGISEVTLTWVNRVLRAFTFYQYARDR